MKGKARQTLDEESKRGTVWEGFEGGEFSFKKKVFLVNQ